MLYRVRTILPDNKAQDPGVEVPLKDVLHTVDDALRNDYDFPFPVGTQVIVERIR